LHSLIAGLFFIYFPYEGSNDCQSRRFQLIAGDSLELPCAVRFPYFQTLELGSKIVFLICGRLFRLFFVIFSCAVEIVVFGASVSQVPLTS
jgi:hypothetical protein